MSATAAKQIKSGDIRRMLNLVSETSRLDAKTYAPPIHALKGLVNLTRSRIGIIAHVRRLPGEALQIDSFIDSGWEQDTSDRNALIRAALEPGYVDAVLEQGFQHFEKVPCKPTGFTRRSFFGDSEWYASQCYADHRKPARIDDCVYSIYYLGQAGAYACVGLHRGAGDRVSYTERDRQIADYVWQSLGWMHHHALTEPAHTPAAARYSLLSTLPHELLTTWNLLKSPGRLTRAHAKIGLTKSEFERRIHRVYQHFGVTSRLELLARVVDDARL